MVDIVPTAGELMPIAICSDDLSKLLLAELSNDPTMGVIDVPDIRIASMVTAPEIEIGDLGSPRNASAPPMVHHAPATEPTGSCSYSCDYLQFRAAAMNEKCGCQGQVIDECGVCGAEFFFGHNATVSNYYRDKSLVDDLIGTRKSLFEYPS
jgi:hypothetical protein